MTFKFPHYREMARRFNFDDYSSKGSTVHPVKKYHPRALALKGAAQDLPEEALDGQVQTGTAHVWGHQGRGGGGVGGGGGGE